MGSLQSPYMRADDFTSKYFFGSNSTTSTDEHSFDGAFAVLAGSSVHSTYMFQEAARTSTRVVVGDLVHQHSEVLKVGAVRAIRAGRSFIHSLFHMDHPSVSIVVRTLQARDMGVQYNYYAPYVGIDPYDRDVWGRRAGQYIDAALAMKDPRTTDLVRTAMAHTGRSCLPDLE